MCGGNTLAWVGQKAPDWQLRMLVCPLLPVLHHCSFSEFRRSTLVSGAAATG